MTARATGAWWTGGSFHDPGSPLRATIAAWRATLARDLGDRHPTLGGGDLAARVDRALVLCLFLRLGEERGLLPPGTLAGLAGAADIAARLAAAVREAGGVTTTDAAGSGTPGCGDRPLRAILAALATPQPACHSPRLPIELLGQVHEYCLARPLRRGRAPGGATTARKATGSYYTPAPIVDYLVRATLADLPLGGAGNGPTVLDPACGAGAFLVGAYRALLDRYRAEGPGRHPDMLRRGADGAWHLTADARRHILLAHIHGVDREARAIEVAGLTLLLLWREDTAGEAGTPPPDLARNLRCGDALIGPDIRDHPAAAALDAREIAALRPLDWPGAFPAIMARGGFDVVLGNPPYLSYSGRQAAALPEPVRRYLSARFAAGGWPAAHTFFIEQAARLLARRRCAFVVPDQVGHLAGYAPIRALLARQAGLVEVRYWGEGVFADATTPALTFVADRAHAGPTAIRERDGTASAARIAGGQPWQGVAHAALLAQIRRDSESLGALVADPGVHTGNCAARLIAPLAGAGGDAVPILEGKQVGRYRCDQPTSALHRGYRPAPGEYCTIRPEARYAAARFVIRQTAPYPIVGPRRHATYFRNSLLALYAPDDGRAVEYLVGLLNSSLMRYVYEATVRESAQRAFPQVKVGALRALPIRRLDLADPRDRAAHDAIVAAVRRLLARHERAAPGELAGDALAAELATLDRALDRLVYALYGLDDGQIAAIDAAVPRDSGAALRLRAGR